MAEIIDIKSFLVKPEAERRESSLNALTPLLSLRALPNARTLAYVKSAPHKSVIAKDKQKSL